MGHFFLGLGSPVPLIRAYPVWSRIAGLLRLLNDPKNFMAAFF
jgi:hypothetical protein